MNQTRTMWKTLTWIAVAILAVAILAACGGDDDTAPPPGAAATPTPPADDAPDNAAASGDGLRLAAVLAAEDSRSVAYSPDGSQVALASGAGIWLYPADMQSSDQRIALQGHDDSVTAVAWSPDGTQVASASLDETVRIWDAASGEAVTTLEGHSNWVLDVVWSPDGSQVASASTDGTLRLWDVETGDELAQLGSYRIESINVRFRDAGTFDTLAELDYARTVLGTLDGEPLSDLVEAVLIQGYAIAIAFEDPAQVDLLLALHDTPPTVRITTPDDALSEELATLSDDEFYTLALALHDPQVTATLDELDEAEATIAAIYARDDAELIRAVRRLQNEAIVLTIERADGESTTISPAEGDLVAHVAELGDTSDISLSFGIENEAAIVERLQDPDFRAAVAQLDAAQDTVSAITGGENAAELLLIRRLLASEYTIELSTGDAALDATLAALDNAAQVDLLRLVQDSEMLGTLRRLASVENRVSDLETYDLSAIVAALAPLDHSVRVIVDEPDLTEQIAALEPADVLRLAALLEDRVLRYAILKAEEAEQIVADIQARDDIALINLLRKLENPRTMETIISAPENSDDVRISRKRNEADYVLSFPLMDEAAILAQSALSDDDLAAQFAAQSADDLIAALETDIYAVVPELTTADIGVVMQYIAGDKFTVSVQREANAHQGSVTATAWSPDGTYLASTGNDLTLRLWDPATRQLLNTLELDEVGTALAWSPDGAQLLSGDWDTNATLWDISTGAESAGESDSFGGHDERVTAAAWSPDGSRVATVGRGGLLILWDVASGDALAEIAAHTGDIRAVTWSPDGTRLITTSLDGTAKLWDVAVQAAE